SKFSPRVIYLIPALISLVPCYFSMQLGIDYLLQNLKFKGCPLVIFCSKLPINNLAKKGVVNFFHTFGKWYFVKRS
ncbi:hypothetical protein L9F63_012823, partial [Diploptera punctata]